MNPLLLSSLISLIPTLGGLFKGAGKDPYKKQLARLQAILSPQALLGDTNSLYQGMVNSPAFAHSQSSALYSARNLANNTANSLANRGLFNTGIGAMLGPMSQAAGAFQLGNLRSGAYQNAFDQASRMRMALASGNPQTNPNQVPNALFGSGLSGLGDILGAYLRSKYPSNPAPMRQ